MASDAAVPDKGLHFSETVHKKVLTSSSADCSVGSGAGASICLPSVFEKWFASLGTAAQCAVGAHRYAILRALNSADTSSDIQREMDFFSVMARSSRDLAGCAHLCFGSCGEGA